MHTDDGAAPLRPTRRLHGVRLGWAACVLGALPLVASHLPLVFPLELACHFVVQAVLGLLCVAGVALAGRHRGLAAAALLLAAAYAPSLSPFYGPVPAAPACTTRLRLVSANLLYTHREHELMRRWLRKVRPDVLVLVELSPPWADALRPELSGFSDRVERVLGTGFGIGIYSRLPMAQRTLWASDGQPPIAEVQLRLAGTSLRVIAAHPPPPVRAWATRLRDRELRRLGAALRGAKLPTVLAGDLNTSSWSPIFREAFPASTLRDSRQGLGVQGSWPSALPAWLRVPIDHVLTGPFVATLHRELGPSFGSDHLPVVADLAVCAF